MILSVEQAINVINNNVVGVVNHDDGHQYYIINNNREHRTDHVLKAEMDEYIEDCQELFPWWPINV